jgi:hypothetical protein
VNVEHEEVLMPPGSRPTGSRSSTGWVGSSSTSCRPCTSSASIVPIRWASGGPPPRAGEVPAGNVLVSPEMWWLPASRPCHAGRRDARRHVRRAYVRGTKDGSTARSTSPMWSTTQTRCATMAPVRVWQTAVNPPSPWSCWPRAPGPAGEWSDRDLRRRPVPGVVEGSDSAGLRQSLDAPGADEPADKGLIRRHDDRYEAVARQFHRRRVR